MGFSLMIVKTGLFASFAGAFFLAAEALTAIIAMSAIVRTFLIMIIVV
jgi:hypothetical protein